MVDRLPAWHTERLLECWYHLLQFTYHSTVNLLRKEWMQNISLGSQRALVMATIQSYHDRLTHTTKFLYLYVQSHNDHCSHLFKWLCMFSSTNHNRATPARRVHQKFQQVLKNITLIALYNCAIIADLTTPSRLSDIVDYGIHGLRLWFSARSLIILISAGGCCMLLKAMTMTITMLLKSGWRRKAEVTERLKVDGTKRTWLCHTHEERQVYQQVQRHTYNAISQTHATNSDFYF